MKLKISFMFVVILSMFFIYDVNVNASSYWDFDLSYGNQSTFNVQDQEIDMTYSLNGASGTFSYFLTYDFYQTFQGLAIYDYDGNGPLGNGTLPNGYYKITSGVNSAFRYLYIGYLEFDIYQYNYDFELVKTGNSLSIYWNDTNDPNYENLSGNDVDVVISGIDLDDWYLMVYNELYVADEEAYKQAGYNSGYDDAKSDYGYLVNGVWITASSWGQSRYNDGLAQGDANALSLQNMIPGVMGVFIAFFFQMASISVLGVSVLDLLALMFGVGVALLIFKVLVK